MYKIYKTQETYLKNSVRCISLDLSHTILKPPISEIPTASTVTMDPNIIIAWKASDQRTALSPPCQHSFERLNKIREKARLTTLVTYN